MAQKIFRLIWFHLTEQCVIIGLVKERERDDENRPRNEQAKYSRLAKVQFARIAQIPKLIRYDTSASGSSRMLPRV